MACAWDFCPISNNGLPFCTNFTSLCRNCPNLNCHGPICQSHSNALHPGWQVCIYGQKFNVQAVQYWALLDTGLLANSLFCHQEGFASYWSDSVNKEEPNAVYTFSIIPDTAGQVALHIHSPPSTMPWYPCNSFSDFLDLAKKIATLQKYGNHFQGWKWPVSIRQQSISITMVLVAYTIIGCDLDSVSDSKLQPVL